MPPHCVHFPSVLGVVAVMDNITELPIISFASSEWMANFTWALITVWNVILEAGQTRDVHIIFPDH